MSSLAAQYAALALIFAGFIFSIGVANDEWRSWRDLPASAVRGWKTILTGSIRAIWKAAKIVFWIALVIAVPAGIWCLIEVVAHGPAVEKIVAIVLAGWLFVTLYFLPALGRTIDAAVAARVEEELRRRCVR